MQSTMVLVYHRPLKSTRGSPRGGSRQGSRSRAGAETPRVGFAGSAREPALRDRSDPASQSDADDHARSARQGDRVVTLPDWVSRAFSLVIGFVVILLGLAGILVPAYIQSRALEARLGVRIGRMRGRDPRGRRGDRLGGGEPRRRPQLAASPPHEQYVGCRRIRVR